MTAPEGIRRVWDELAATTAEHCRRTPRDAAIRDHLLNLEGGFTWGEPLAVHPLMFEFSQHPETWRVTHRDSKLTDTLVFAATKADGDIGVGLVAVASTYEAFGRFRRMGTEHPAPDAPDLFPGDEDTAGEGAVILGWGIAAEVFGFVGTMDDLPASGKLDPKTHPGRFTLRELAMADRYGAYWTVQRVHGDTAAQVHRVDPDQVAVSSSGNIGHALARMTQTVVGTAVPIPDGGCTCHGDSLTLWRDPDEGAHS